MKRGPPPKPTNLKLIQGNPGRRPLEKLEPQPQVVAPDCPDHLGADAKAEWDRITPKLLRYHLVTEIDTAALALYCISYGRWRLAERKIAEMRDNGHDGLLISTSTGYLIPNPYLGIANRAMDDLSRHIQQFGLSPSARTRVTVNVLQGDLFVGPDAGGNKYF
jgi:P27 family predicted phage terminase small subunit